MSTLRLDDLKNSLKKLGIYIKSHKKLNRSEINKSTSILESIFSNTDIDLEEQKMLIEYSKKNDFLSLFQKIYEKYEINLEKEFAKSFIDNDKTYLEKYHFYAGYLKAVKKTTRLASIKKNDKVAFVGSGAMPMTAIILHKITGVAIDCFEKDSQSVELSRKVINKLGQERSVKVISKNATEEDFSKYSVILLAVLAKPKKDLMRIIWKSIVPGTRIIYRLPSTERTAYYEDTSAVLNHYQEFEKKRIIGKRTSSLILLIKN